MRAGTDLRRRLSTLSGETRLLIGLSGLLALVVLLNRFGVLTPDTKPEMFLQPGQTARRFASAWLDTPNLGAANYNTGTGVVAAFFAVLDAVGVPAWLIGRLWRIMLLLVAGWGARLLVRDLVRSTLTERGMLIAGVAGAIAYVVNPYVIVGGGTTPTLQPYALLPWLAVCWVRGSRNPSWRWAALAALALAGMGGINAGIVPLMQLVIVIPLMAYAVLGEGHRFGSVLWLMLRTGLIYILLSAYWVVPALGAFGFATAIAQGSETTEAINMANSFPEILRGLGMWTLYGLDGSGPFDPNRIAFVSQPVVILLSFGGPILAALGVLWSRSPARIFSVTSILVGALIMVGSFTTGSPTLWARALSSFIDSVPGMLAFRTTNKVGAVLELGLAVLIGLAAAALAERLVTLWQRVTALVLAALVAAGSVAPALTGGLFWIPMDTPDYWFEAAETVNARGGGSRVLMVPGVGVPTYAWGYSGPDELGPSLFTRPFVFRSAALGGGTYGAALLAEVDRRLHDGTLPAGTMSTMAEYLGVGDIVGRHDLAGTGNLGARVESQLSDDPGLGPATVFGPAEAGRGAPGAVTVREVTGATDAETARARTGSGALILDGSGAALPGLTQAGLLDRRPALLLAGGLDDEHLAAALAAGGRLVLTDSNLRREWSPNNPAGVGPVQAAADSSRHTRDLFSPEQQTTAELRGNATVTTDGTGMLFGPYAFGGVEQAFDGDRTTSWRFGNFGTGVGNSVTIVPDEPLPMPTITLAPHQGGTSFITSARVTARLTERTVTQDVTFSQWRSFPASVVLPAEPVSGLEITVTGVGGGGDGAVGFSEISIPGVQVSSVVTASADLATRAPAAAADAGVDLAGVPVDVILERGLGDAAGVGTPQARLEREFTLPDRRDFTVAGTFRLAGGISDAQLDQLAGTTGGITAEASSRLFHRPSARASMAVDSTPQGPDLTTAWVPNEPVVGEWISLDFAPRRMTSFTLTQNTLGDLATTVLVSINDEEPFEVDLGPGRNWIPVPTPTEAHRVRILITERGGGGFVRFEHIDLHGPRTPADTGSAATGCVRIATIDGVPLLADIGDHLEALLAGGAVPIEPCRATIDLAAGQHRLESVPDYAIDTLHLRTARVPAAQTAATPLEVVTHDGDLIRVRLPAGCRDCVVSSGQAHDPRWRATADGVDLGPPVIADGFAAGWIIADLPPGSDVVMEFAPRRAVLAAWFISAGTLLGCAVALGVHPWRRRRPRHALGATAGGES